MDPARHMAVASDVLAARKMLADESGIDFRGDPSDSRAIRYEKIIGHMARSAVVAESLVEQVKPAKVRELRGEPVERDDHAGDPYYGPMGDAL